MTSRKVRVVAGPSKWDLMISFFEQERQVVFTTEDGEEFSFVVDAMLNDAHWDSFDTDGNRFYENVPTVSYGNAFDDWFVYGVVHDDDAPTSLMFHYSTHTRSGVVRIIKDVDYGTRGHFRDEWAKRLTQHQL